MSYIAWFEELSRRDVPLVGGKGANLGELARAGLPVPPGFVVTVEAFEAFLKQNALEEEIDKRLEGLAVDDQAALHATAETLQARIRKATMPKDVQAALAEAYRELGRRSRAEGGKLFVAARSSATAEDSAEASFAGMFVSLLNVGSEAELFGAVKDCWASSFGARVLFYRIKQGQGGTRGLLAVVVQQMVNSEKAGVMFTVDPSAQDPGQLMIEASWGLGETVVGGQVEPDRFVVRKADLSIVTQFTAEKSFELVRDERTGATRQRALSAERGRARCLSDEEVRTIAELGVRTERHYGVPQDIEFAVEKGRTFLVQTRPITVGLKPPPEEKKAAVSKAHRVLVRGLGASPGRVSGKVRVLRAPDEGARLEEGEILVAPMTTPDWVPYMRRAAAVVTDSGGMTSHAAIVSRELGVPCIVGTRTGTSKLEDGRQVTVDGRQGAVYSGELPAAPAPKPAMTAGGGAEGAVTGTRLYVNLGEPARAAEVAALPVDGVGLLRAEFLILESLQGAHPRLLLERGQAGAFVERLSAGVGQIAAAFHPRPVIYRSMDFRTNEFRGLEGGEKFEPLEANPMIGYRGCFRYVREPDLFRLELEVLRNVRAQFDNLHLMIPFVRTASEFEDCRRHVEEAGLRPGRNFQLWVMAEVPSVVHWIPTYARLGASGISIGSNDLTQLTLGVDRDSEVLSGLFDERDEAVLAAIRQILEVSHRAGLTTSICGQAPSVHPGYAEQLVGWGIDSVSVSVDAIDATRRNIAAAERRLLLQHARAASEGARAARRER
jgi:pyruvate, water dikinase